MAVTDIPPSHVPSHVVPTCGHLLEIGGGLWTLCYLLLMHESLRTHSYGMPFLALAFNLGWEAVYGLYVAELQLEKFVFTIWLVVDLGLIYGIVKNAKHEWKHAPFVARNIGPLLALSTAGMAWGNLAFVKWWLENSIALKKGKFYCGVEGPDTTEMAFWTAAFGQALLSVASLAQLVVRQHSGGVSWLVWASRTFGTIIGFNMNYGWGWYFWREAYQYVMSPLGIFFWVTGLVCDLVYPFVLWQVRKTEVVMPDGRKVSGEDRRDAEPRRDELKRD